MTGFWQVYELKGRPYYIERHGNRFHRYESRPQIRAALQARRQPGAQHRLYGLQVLLHT